MKCSNCPKQAKIRHIDKMLCPACFSKIIERKVKQEFKKYGMKKDDKVCVEDVAVARFLEVIKLPLKVGKTGRKIVPWTIDDEIEEFLTAMLEGRKVKSKDIRLLRQISKQDVEEYMKSKGVKYLFERSELNRKIDALTEKYPQTKNSILKSIEELQKDN